MADSNIGERNLHGDFVIAGPERSDFKDALVVAGGATHGVRGGGGKLYVGTGDGIVLRVDDGAAEDGIIALPEGTRRGKQQS
jgi:hypothetical protein